MPLIFDHSRQPPGGHYFKDPSGHTIRAKTLSDLISFVSEYRTNNGFCAGNPYTEIESFYSEQFPWLITKVGDVPAESTDPTIKWINRVYRETLKTFAESETTKSRIEICESCPHYAKDHQFDFESKRRLTIAGSGRLKSMGACKAHNLACGLAVVMDKIEVPIKVEGCWII